MSQPTGLEFRAAVEFCSRARLGLAVEPRWRGERTAQLLNQRLRQAGTVPDGGRSSVEPWALALDLGRRFQGGLLRRPKRFNGASPPKSLWPVSA